MAPSARADAHDHRALALAGLLAFTGAPQAAPAAGGCSGGVPVFYDGFDEYPIGFTQSTLGDTWSGGGTNVDVIRPGLADLLPGNGNYIDMEGTGGNSIGHLTSEERFEPGSYCLRVSVAGNQRNNDADTLEIRFGGESRTMSRSKTAPFSAAELRVTTTSPSAIELIAGGVGNLYYGLLVGEVELVAVSATVTETAIDAPLPGRSAKVSEPLDATSTEATVTVTGSTTDLVATGLAVEEKAQRLKRLKGVQERLTKRCNVLVWVAHDVGIEDLDIEPQAAFRNTCRLLLGEVQSRIAELTASRPAGSRAPAAAESGCQILTFHVLSERRGGKTTVRVVERGAKPRLRLTCGLTIAGLEIDVERRGTGTLRAALGKALVLTARRSDAAPAPLPGSTLTFAFEQR